MVVKKRQGRSTMAQQQTKKNSGESTEVESDEDRPIDNGPIIEDTIDVDQQPDEGDDVPADDDVEEDEEDSEDEEEASAEGDMPWLDDVKCPDPDMYHIIGPGQPLKITGIRDGQFVTLDKPVVRAYQMRRSDKWYFKLIYAKSARVPYTAVLEEGGEEVLHGASPIRTMTLHEARFPAASAATPETFTLPKSA